MGMKGQRRGSAVVSPVHANFIVTEGENARAEDALALAEEIENASDANRGLSWNTRSNFGGPNQEPQMDADNGEIRAERSSEP